MKDFVKILLGAVIGVLCWQMFAANGFALPELQPQRMTPPQVQIIYPTTEPAQVQIIQPTWMPPTATAVPSATPTATQAATSDAQRGTQDSERGCASTRSCGDD